MINKNLDKIILQCKKIQEQLKQKYQKKIRLN